MLATTNANDPISTVWKACCDITGSDMKLDSAANLFDLGIDSLGLAELVIQLEEVFGEGAISVDDIMEDPVVSQVAMKLSGAKSTPVASKVQATSAPAPAVRGGSSDSGATGEFPQTAVNVWKACCTITGNDMGGEMKIDMGANLFDIGIDSLGLAELVIQLEEVYGEGAITVDDIMANPIVSEIASRLPGGMLAKPPIAIKKPVAPAVLAAKPAQKPLIAAKPAQKPLVAAKPAQKPLVAAKPAQRPPPASKPVQKPVEIMKAPLPPVAPTPPFPVAPTPSLAPESLTESEVLSRLSQLESVCSQLAEAVKLLAPAVATAGVNATAIPADTPLLTAAAAAPPSASPPLEEAICEKFDDAVSAQPAFEPPPDDWIRTSHVGSLPRPTGDEELSPTAIIALQKSVGIDVINDGEWSRDNYIADMLSRIEGIGGGENLKGKACLCDMPLAADMADVPLYAQRFTGGNGIITLNPKRIARADTACTDMPKYRPNGQAELLASLQPFLDSIAAAGLKPSSTFWSTPSPGAIAVFSDDQYFHHHVSYVEALAEAMRPEFEAIASTGVLLQVDCPDLAMGRHTKHVDLTDDEFFELASANVAALNKALANIPREQVRIHVCWGNYAGPHHCDIDAAFVWPIVAKIKAKYILTEAANPRHGHEIKAFEDAVSSGLIDSSMVICPGVIDTTAARVEHPELIAQKLLRFVRAVGDPRRVIAATDCGFASTAKSVAITSDLAWRKLGALVEGAALATRMYLEASAPVPMNAPSLAPTPFRACVFIGETAAAAAAGRAIVDQFGHGRASSVDVMPCSAGVSVPRLAQEAFTAMRWAVDFPIAFLAVGGGNTASIASRTAALLRADDAASRRPSTVFVCGGALPADGAIDAGDATDAPAVVELIRSTMMAGTGYDKRLLAQPRNEKPVPATVDVVVVGGGLLGMCQAVRLRAKGHSVAILEQRSLVGGIWSMYANSTSQVNSSEGGYCLKDLLPDSSPRRHAHNRDHSTAAEVLADINELGKSLEDVIYTQVQVVRVLGTNGDYQVIANQEGSTQIVACKGVVLAINDRVGMPRPLRVPGMDTFQGAFGDGTSDALVNTDFQGKRVVIFGMGAFAVENVRTALEAGAAHVTVCARRLGTICPKMIDYLNFVKPWDEHYRHDTTTNVKQMRCWRRVYAESGATAPECWPTKVKHDGHTISVSDIWFVASHLGKLATKIGTLERMDPTGCVLSDGSFLEADVVIGCIGFERNTTFCEQLTGRTTVKYSNYLDKNMMYLADAEIDESAFNSFFGSSVLEYAKFYTRVFVEGFERPDALGKYLWADEVASVPVSLRKWTQYIATGAELIANDAAICEAAATQVRERTAHFYRTMPPRSFVDVNRKEWEELHTRLNGGVPMPLEKQLAYPFPEAADWCLPREAVLGK